MEMVYSVFTTEPEPVDVTPPSVVSVSPVNGATDVSVSVTVEAIFSESIGSGSIVLMRGDTASVQGAMEVQETQIVFTPSRLVSGSSYTAHLEAEDLAGNKMNERTWTFVTEYIPTDTTPPSVVNVSPEDFAADVPVTVQLIATLSEPVGSGEIVLHKSGSLVFGTSRVEDNRIVFMPSISLMRNAQYAWRIAAEDTAGNTMEMVYSVFTTEPEPVDLTPPSVISVTPVPDAENVSRDVVITVTFSEPVQNVSLAIYYGSGNMPGLVVTENNTVTFTPNQPLIWGAFYNVYASAEDTAGNVMYQDYFWSFTVMADPTPGWVLPDGYATYGAGKNENGDVFVVGSYLRPGSSGAAIPFVAKWNAFGILEWTTRGEGFGALQSVTGAGQYVYASGLSPLECHSVDTGEGVWATTIDPTGSSYGITVAPDGNIYCRLYGGRIAKVSPGGTLLWTKKFGQDIEDMAFDSQMNLYVGGETREGSENGYEDWYVRKFDVNLNLVWERFMRTPALDQRGWIALAETQNIVYQAGSIGALGGSLLVQARNATTGDLVWEYTNTSEAGSVSSIVTDTEGNAYLDFNYKVHKLRPSGTVAWTTKQMGSGVTSQFVLGEALFVKIFNISRLSTLTGEPLP